MDNETKTKYTISLEQAMESSPFKVAYLINENGQYRIDTTSNKVTGSQIIVARCTKLYGVEWLI